MTWVALPRVIQAGSLQNDGPGSQQCRPIVGLSPDRSVFSYRWISINQHQSATDGFATSRYFWIAPGHQIWNWKQTHPFRSPVIETWSHSVMLWIGVIVGADATRSTNDWFTYCLSQQCQTVLSFCFGRTLHLICFWDPGKWYTAYTDVVWFLPGVPCVPAF